MTISPGNQAINFLIFDKSTKTIQRKKDSLSINGAGTTEHPWTSLNLSQGQSLWLGAGSDHRSICWDGNRRQPCCEVRGRAWAAWRQICRHHEVGVRGCHFHCERGIRLLDEGKLGGGSRGSGKVRKKARDGCPGWPRAQTRPCDPTASEKPPWVRG